MLGTFVVEPVERETASGGREMGEMHGTVRAWSWLAVVEPGGQTLPRPGPPGASALAPWGTLPSSRWSVRAHQEPDLGVRRQTGSALSENQTGLGTNPPSFTLKCVAVGLDFTLADRGGDAQPGDWGKRSRTRGTGTRRSHSCGDTFSGEDAAPHHGPRATPAPASSFRTRSC